MVMAPALPTAGATMEAASIHHAPGISPQDNLRRSGERHAVPPARPARSDLRCSPHGYSACLMERPRGLLPVRGSAWLSQG